jgi:hypothetical protein
MSSRRAFLMGSPASLLPRAVRAQSPSLVRELLALLMARHCVPGVFAALIRDCRITERTAIGAGPRTPFQAASTLDALFRQAGQDPFRPAL